MSESKIAIILQAGTETHEGLARAAANVPFSAQYMNHPSVAGLVKDGFQIWIL